MNLACKLIGHRLIRTNQEGTTEFSKVCYRCLYPLKLGYEGDPVILCKLLGHAPWLTRTGKNLLGKLVTIGWESLYCRH